MWLGLISNWDKPSAERRGWKCHVVHLWQKVEEFARQLIAHKGQQTVCCYCCFFFIFAPFLVKSLFRFTYQKNMYKFGQMNAYTWKSFIVLLLTEDVRDHNSCEHEEYTDVYLFNIHWFVTNRQNLWTRSVRWQFTSVSRLPHWYRRPHGLDPRTNPNLVYFRYFLSGV